MATEKQIRDAYRRTALRQHPDKAVAQGMSKEEAEERFKAVQDAYEVLSDPARRREFDSIDEFDDYLPSTCDAGEFYKVFGAAFKRQSKWSEKKPVPPVGDDATPWRQVEKFYDFWYKLKSWREFPHPDEEDENAADSRDERRWIQKHNQKLRAKAKKEEARRLRDFVDAAWNCDPRVAANHADKKMAREERKAEKRLQKQREEEEARRRKEEEEARRRAEEEARAAAEEEQRARDKEERKRLREHRAAVGKTCRERSLASGPDISLLCENCTLGEFEALATRLADVSLGEEASRGAVHDLLRDVRERLAREEEERAARAAETEEKMRQEKAESHDRKMQAMGPWSEEELRLLEKGLKKFPVGTKQRWEQVAGFVRTRTVDEVVIMVKDHLAKGKVPANMVKDGIVIKEKYKENLNIKSGISVRDQAFTDVQVQDASDRDDLRTPGAAVKAVSSKSGEWSAVQEQALVTAMKTFGKDVAERWDKIALAVPGKSKGECFARFKELQEAHKAKRAAPAPAPAPAPTGPESDTWSAAQEQALVQALKAVGKDEDGRWGKVAALVEGKSEAQCQAKFKALKAAHAAKKAAK